MKLWKVQKIGMLRSYYIAHLSGGAKIGIDDVNGEKSASNFWEHNELELALETWSSHSSKTKCDINQQLYRTKKLNFYISYPEDYSYFL